MWSALESRAAEGVGPLVEKFATSSGRWLGWVGVGVGAVMVGSEPVTSGQLNSRVALFGVALACLSWVAMVRPQASVHRDALLMRNMVRDIAIPWQRIERCRVGQTLQVSTDDAVTYHGLGVTRSARTMMREQHGTTSILLTMGRRLPAEQRKSREGPSVASGEYQSGTYTSYVESRISGLAASGQGDDTAQPVIAWAPLPVALLALAVVCVMLAFI